MRVLYLHQYFVTPSMSGGTRSYELARRLVAAGHEVHVITSSREVPQFGAPKWTTTNEEGIQVHWTSVAYTNQFGFFRRLRAFVLFAWRAAWRSVKVGGDVVFATSTPLTIALPAIVAARWIRVPMVFEVRDLWPDIPIAMGEIRNPAVIWLARKLEKLAYRNSAKIIALSPGMADGIVRTGYPRTDIAVIPNACDIDLFQSAGENLAPGFLPPGQGPLVLYAGTFGRVNGVGYLVDMAAEMKRLDPTIRFLLVGDGKEREQVEAKARDNGTLAENLWFRPPISKRQMPALLRHATIATSVVIDVKELWNNSANKVFDALAGGKPVLINHQGWQKDILETHGAGLSVRHDDPAEAAHSLREFLRSGDKLAQAERAALELAATQFNRDRLGECFREILESATGRAPPADRVAPTAGVNS